MILQGVVLREVISSCMAFISALLIYRERREMERGRCWDVVYEMKGEEGLLIAVECLVLM